MSLFFLCFFSYKKRRAKSSPLIGLRVGNSLSNFNHVIAFFPATSTKLTRLESIERS